MQKNSGTFYALHVVESLIQKEEEPNEIDNRYY